MELQKLIDGLKAHKNGAASYESVEEAIRVFEAMLDVDGEKVCKGLKCLISAGKHCENCEYDEHGLCGSDLIVEDALALIRQQQERIKELEHEISRLKQHVDCDAAEKITSGCIGYGRGINDDEPCETCKECPEYNLYGVE